MGVFRQLFMESSALATTMKYPVIRRKLPKLILRVRAQWDTGLKLLRVYGPQSINTQKKDLANIRRRVDFTFGQYIYIY